MILLHFNFQSLHQHIKYKCLLYGNHVPETVLHWIPSTLGDCLPLSSAPRMPCLPPAALSDTKACLETDLLSIS